LDDLRSGKLENQANFILSECFREAASTFSMINQQLKRDGYAASIDPSIFIWLANITETETRDTGTMRLEIVPNHRGRPSTYARQVAQFIWHLVEGKGCRRQAAYRGALTKFTVSASLAWRSVQQIASRMPAGSQRHYRHRHVFVHCSQSLQSTIPTMIIEPAATTTEQITGNSSRTARTAARPLRFRAKRQLATPIRKLRLAQRVSNNAKQLPSNLPIRGPPATTPAPVLRLLSNGGHNLGDLKQKFCA
jgi:hypothetical protein